MTGISYSCRSYGGGVVEWGGVGHSHIMICTKCHSFDSLVWYVLTKRPYLFHTSPKDHTFHWMTSKNLIFCYSQEQNKNNNKNKTNKQTNKQNKTNQKQKTNKNLYVVLDYDLSPKDP